jgi:hypothetical protein
MHCCIVDVFCQRPPNVPQQHVALPFSIQQRAMRSR